MTNLAVTNELFFDRTGMDPGRVETIVGEALAGMDDGELFLEYSQSESVSLDDGRIKRAAFDTTQSAPVASAMVRRAVTTPPAPRRKVPSSRGSWGPRLLTRIALRPGKARAT